MKKFAKGQKLKQVALMAIAVQSDPNDIEELKVIFQALDNDGNGSITFEELQRGLGQRENGDELISILKGADTDNSGTINYTGKSNSNFYLTFLFLVLLIEFLAAAMDQTMFLRDTYMKTAFQMLDADGSGSIDSSELLKLLAGEEFRDVYSQSQLDQAIREID